MSALRVKLARLILPRGYGVWRPTPRDADVSPRGKDAIGV